MFLPSFLLLVRCCFWVSILTLAHVHSEDQIDVKNMLLDIDKIKALGWKPKNNSEQAITKTVKELTAKTLNAQR